MKSAQIRAGLQALLDKLDSIDLTPQDRHALTERIMRMMQA